MKIFRIAEEEINTKADRTLGKSVREIKGRGLTKVYRAVSNEINEFKSKDYVTFSLKFAVEHAENNAIYYGEPQKVIHAMIPNDKLYEASNPGEYFYDGENLAGKTIYQTKGYDFEGFEELTANDFIY